MIRRDDSRSGLPSWLWPLPGKFRLALCAAVMAMVQGVLAVVAAAAWIRIAAFIVILIIAVAIEMDKARIDHLEKRAMEAKALEDEEDAERQWHQRARRALLSWPPVSSLEFDPFRAGVARLTRTPGYSGEGAVLPAYIGRDVDSIALDRLRKRGLVLLVGAAVSGVTRTAYESAMKQGDQRLILAPTVSAGLSTLLDDLDVVPRLGAKRLVLWLDRIDRFASGTLSSELLHRLREQSPGVRVVATIGTATYSSWAVEHPDLAAEFGLPVMVHRQPSEAEVKRANQLHPEVNFKEGFAAAFTATGALMLRLSSGLGTCPVEPPGGDCLLARSLVEACVEWGATGTPRPLDMARLVDLVSGRLGVPDRPDDEHLQVAMAWATTPTSENVRLLDVDDDGEAVRAHAGVIEVHSSELTNVPVATWMSALEDAESARDFEAVGRIGFQAQRFGRADVRDSAWGLVTDIDSPACVWLKRAAEVSHRDSDYAAEVASRQRLVDLAEEAFGSQAPAVATHLKDLAIAWLGLGRPSEAQSLLEQALRIREQSDCPGREVAVVLTFLADAKLQLEEPVPAREILTRARDIIEREHGPVAHELARILTYLGDAASALGRADVARDYLERALAIEEREHGLDHASVAAVLNSLGAALSDLGERTRAREVQQRALDILEREERLDQRSIAGVQASLGLTWIHLGEPAKARDLLVRARRITEKEYGVDDVRTAYVLTNLGLAQSELGELPKAKEAASRALEVLESAWGSGHVRLTAALKLLGDSCIGLGRPDEGREHLLRALQIRESAFGTEHPELAPILNSLGNAEADRGQPGEARRHLARALRIMRIHFANGHPDIDALINNLRSVSPDALLFDDPILRDAEK